jgi:hypothetical protein
MGRNDAVDGRRRVIYRYRRLTWTPTGSTDIRAAAERLQRATAADERTRELPIVDLTHRGLA